MENKIEDKTEFEKMKTKVFQFMRETSDFIFGLAAGLLVYHFSIM